MDILTSNQTKYKLSRTGDSVLFFSVDDWFLSSKTVLQFERGLEIQKKEEAKLFHCNDNL